LRLQWLAHAAEVLAEEIFCGCSADDFYFRFEASERWCKSAATKEQLDKAYAGITQAILALEVLLAHRPLQ
jgi:hypothetical protein